MDRTIPRRLFGLAYTALIFAVTSPCLAAPLALHAEVINDAGLVAESGPEPVQRFFPPPEPLPSSIATPQTLLTLSAETPDDYFSTPNWVASSEVSITGNQIVWTINTMPGDAVIVPQVLTPMEHTHELGMLSAGEYELITYWFDEQRGPLVSATSLAGTATTTFRVVPEPASLGLIGIATCCLLSRRRR